MLRGNSCQALVLVPYCTAFHLADLAQIMLFVRAAIVLEAAAIITRRGRCVIGMARAFLMLGKPGHGPGRW